MSETYVVNPILVQGFHPDIPSGPDNPDLTAHDEDNKIAAAFKQRLENQVRLGSNPERYFDLSKPEDLSSLSPHRLAELALARAVSTQLPSTPYFLSETALTSERVFEDLRCRLWGREALLRVEEGLTWRAAETMHAVKDSVDGEPYTKDGKTYIELPGFKSPVALAGWWLGGSQQTENGETERLSITDIPSCEVYMATTISDQAKYGDSLVRIVPWSMEDREVSAVRMLQSSGRLPDFRDAVSVIVAQNGDIKKLRTWTKTPTPPQLLDVLNPHKVDGKISQLAEQYSTGRRKHYAELYKQLPSDLRELYASPNQNEGSIREQFGRFQTTPYNALAIAEQHKPSEGMSAAILEDVSTGISQLLDGKYGQVGKAKLAGSSDVVVEHYPGANTNNVYYVRIPLCRYQLKTEATESLIACHMFFGRVTSEQEAFFKNMVDEFDKSSIVPQQLMNFLKTNGNEPRYILVDGEKEKV